MSETRPCLHLQAQAQEDGRVACLGGCGRVFASDAEWGNEQDAAARLPDEPAPH
jgi:hypothetical protein